jgi:hypothetical protein
MSTEVDISKTEPADAVKTVKKMSTEVDALKCTINNIS